jgi:hypothetical protein
VGEVLEMIKNRKLLERFEAELARKQRKNLKRNLKILDGLYAEAVALGAFPLRDPLDGIETDIKVAKAVNRVH